MPRLSFMRTEKMDDNSRSNSKLYHSDNESDEDGESSPNKSPKKNTKKNVNLLRINPSSSHRRSSFLKAELSKAQNGTTDNSETPTKHNLYKYYLKNQIGTQPKNSYPTMLPSSIQSQKNFEAPSMQDVFGNPTPKNYKQMANHNEKNTSISFRASVSPQASPHNHRSFPYPTASKTQNFDLNSIPGSPSRKSFFQERKGLLKNQSDPRRESVMPPLHNYKINVIKEDDTQVSSYIPLQSSEPPESTRSNQNESKNKNLLSQRSYQSDTLEDKDDKQNKRRFATAHTIMHSHKIFPMPEKKITNIADYYRKEGAHTLRRHISPSFIIILPDDQLKQYWDSLITILLIYCSLITPYNMAFFDEETFTFEIIDYIVDLLFFIDIILNFFSAYYDLEDNLIMDRKVIALTYIKSWFFVDLIAVIPLSLILNSTYDYNSLARIARLPRLYRILKMAKLVRMIRIVREKKKFFKFMNELLKLNASVERLIYFLVIFLILCHITACLFYLTAKLDNFNPNTWVMRSGIYDNHHLEIYTTALYWTITTVTTVGYGDITCFTTLEKSMAIIIMGIGVCSYSFAVGSLSSVLSTLDTKQAKLKEKLEVLEEIKNEYDLTPEMYIKLKKALKYDHSRNISDKFSFINELPHNLKIELSVLMHQDVISSIPFFQDKSPQFVAFVGPLLRPFKVQAGEYIFMEGDPVDEIYFLCNGKAAFVIREYNNLPYIYIEEGSYFGEIDFFASEGNTRITSIQAIEECELLLLSKSDLFKIDLEFRDVFTELLSHANSRLKKTMIIKNKAISYACSARTVGFYRKNDDGSPMSNGGWDSNSMKKSKSIKFYNTLKDIDENDEFNSSSESDSHKDSICTEEEISPSSSSDFSNSKSVFSSSRNLPPENNLDVKEKDKRRKSEKGRTFMEETKTIEEVREKIHANHSKIDLFSSKKDNHIAKIVQTEFQTCLRQFMDKKFFSNSSSQENLSQHKRSGSEASNTATPRKKYMSSQNVQTPTRFIKSTSLKEKDTVVNQLNKSPNINNDRKNPLMKKRSSSLVINFSQMTKKGNLKDTSSSSIRNPVKEKSSPSIASTNIRVNLQLQNQAKNPSAYTKKLSLSSIESFAISEGSH